MVGALREQSRDSSAVATAAAAAAPNFFSKAYGVHVRLHVGRAARAHAKH